MSINNRILSDTLPVISIPYNEVDSAYSRNKLYEYLRKKFANAGCLLPGSNSNPNAMLRFSKTLASNKFKQDKQDNGSKFRRRGNPKAG